MYGSPPHSMHASCLVVLLRACFAVIVRVLRTHGKVDKVVMRGAKAIANIAKASRESSEELVAHGARAVLEAISIDTDSSAKVKASVQEALKKLA